MCRLILIGLLIIISICIINSKPSTSLNSLLDDQLKNEMRMSTIKFKDFCAIYNSVKLNDKIKSETKSAFESLFRNIYDMFKREVGKLLEEIYEEDKDLLIELASREPDNFYKLLNLIDLDEEAYLQSTNNNLCEFQKSFKNLTDSIKPDNKIHLTKLIYNLYERIYKDKDNVQNIMNKFYLFNYQNIQTLFNDNSTKEIFTKLVDFSNKSN
jgi:hypothetical protein